MMRSPLFSLTCLALVGCCGAAPAQTVLPVVEDVNLAELRDHGRRLRESLKTLQAPLSADVDAELMKLLEGEPKDPGEAAEAIQQLLDAQCLVGININPESRVKAVRGPLRAELVLGRETIVLAKVNNEAGVTNALMVSGPQVAGRGKTDRERWLELAVHSDKVLGKSLSGQRVEYVILRLVPREAGKREATLQFDVGQGTQDLGFRAEVPVLFSVRKQ